MVRRQFGDYVLIVEEPETEEKKAELVKKAIPIMIDEFVSREIIPDWNTLSLIVKEGYDFLPTDEGPVYGWNMTVGIKFWSENYPEGLTE